MAAANAEIGVQVAAFYPNITLSADVGTSAASLSKLIGKTGEFWSFGGTLVQTIFDAGLRNAQVQAAIAVFNEDLASYRQTVLTAFQQVEDQLAALRILAAEATVQDAAVASAREAVRVLNNQYLAGTVAYTSVIVAEQTALSRCGNRADDPSEPAGRQRQPDPGTGRRLECFAIAKPERNRTSRTVELQPAAADRAGSGHRPILKLHWSGIGRCILASSQTMLKNKAASSHCDCAADEAIPRPGARPIGIASWRSALLCSDNAGSGSDDDV